MKLGNNNMRNSCFTMKFADFAGAISYYLKEVPLISSCDGGYF